MLSTTTLGAAWALDQDEEKWSERQDESTFPSASDCFTSVSALSGIGLKADFRSRSHTRHQNAAELSFLVWTCPVASLDLVVHDSLSMTAFSLIQHNHRAFLEEVSGTAR
jgi:hypothetical protein